MLAALVIIRKEIPRTEWAMGFNFHISCPTFMFIRHCI